jgi:hypothetical protein
LFEQHALHQQVGGNAGDGGLTEARPSRQIDAGDDTAVTDGVKNGETVDGPHQVAVGYRHDHLRRSCKPPDKIFPPGKHLQSTANEGTALTLTPFPIYLKMSIRNQSIVTQQQSQSLFLNVLLVL